MMENKNKPAAKATKKPQVSKPIEEQAKPLPESVDNPQGTEQTAIPEASENTPEWSPELSPELLKMDAANDPLYDQGASEQPAPKLPKTQVEQAATLANEIAGFLAATVEGVTGRSYGITPDSVKKWSEGVAPCLVKYGLTDMGEIMSKWGVEIQAGISTATLGFGIYSAHRQYTKEEAEAAKEQAANDAATEAA